MVERMFKNCCSVVFKPFETVRENQRKPVVYTIPEIVILVKDYSGVNYSFTNLPFDSIVTQLKASLDIQHFLKQTK